MECCDRRSKTDATVLGVGEGMKFGAGIGFAIVALFAFRFAYIADELKQVRVIAIGDSITHGQGEGSYVEALDGPGYHARAVAFPGYTARDLIREVEPWSAHVVLIQAGTNDLFAGMDPIEGLRDLIREVKRDNPQARIIVGTIPPIQPVQRLERGLLTVDPAKVDAVNAKLPSLCRSEGVTLWRHDIDPATDLLPDGVHPNSRGVSVLGQSWLRAIRAS